jgi:hypothetical protein
MPEDNAPTHIAFVKKHYTKKLFVWLEVGKGRLDNKGHFHGMLDRLPIGGFTGYVCFVPIGSSPPEPEAERPGADEDQGLDGRGI